MINTSNIEIVFDYTAKDSNEIYQCLKVLYTTPAGTVPFNRDFGVRNDITDNTIEVAKALFSADLIEKTRKYEPRVYVKDVTYTYNNGYLNPKVVVELVNS